MNSITGAVLWQSCKNFEHGLIAFSDISGVVDVGILSSSVCYPQWFRLNVSVVRCFENVNKQVFFPP